MQIAKWLSKYSELSSSIMFQKIKSLMVIWFFAIKFDLKNIEIVLYKIKIKNHVSLFSDSNYKMESIFLKMFNLKTVSIFCID